MAIDNSNKSTAAAGNQLTGPMKAALWLLSVDEKTAIESLAHLSEDEISCLKNQVEAIDKISPEKLEEIHQEFQGLLSENPLRVQGHIDYLNQLTKKAIGEDKARKIFELSDASQAASMINETSPDILAPILIEQHPQVAAAIVATLSADQAKKVLLLIPDKLCNDLIKRIAQLKTVSQSALSRAQEALSSEIPTSTDEDLVVDGVKMAASLLNTLDAERAETILKDLGDKAADLTGKIRQAMFTFEDLKKVDKKGMQILLKDVNADQLLISMKLASDEVKAKIFSSLSKRAADMMREDLKMLGPARLSDVEKAQEEIVAVAIKLRNDGKITIIGQGGDFV